MNRSILLIGTLVATLAVFGASCNNQGQNVLDHVAFTVSPNLDKVSVTMFFTNNIQTTTGADFPVKTYGDIFINPTTATTPMQLGFNLNTAIVNDQQYVTFTPTQTFPNGRPIGLNYPIVEIKADKPVSKNFDIFGYVDVLHGNWIGGAAILNFLDQKSFPAGLAINQVFLRDAKGNPEITGNVFGPTLNADGSLHVPGGISVFANIRSLVEHHALKAGQTTSFYPEKGLILTGPRADEFHGQTKALKHIQDILISGMNNLK